MSMPIDRTAARRRSSRRRRMLLSVAMMFPLACQDGRDRAAATPDTVADVSDGAPSAATPAVTDGAELPGGAGGASLASTAPARTPAPVRRMGERRVRTEVLDTRWHRGGSVDDSLLLFPFSMEADDTNVYR